MEKRHSVELTQDAARLSLRHLLPVITTTAADGTRTSRVLCPRRGEPTRIQECGHCGRCLGVMLNVAGLGTVLKCAWQAEGSATSESRLPDGPTIAELMTPDSIPTGRASLHDVMNCSVLGLSASASVARAAALMAYEGVHQLAVLNELGGIEGVITSLDILRWLATRAGFALPGRPIASPREPTQTP